MSDTSKNRPPADAPKRGDAAWRAAREAVASRNDQARRLGRERRDRRHEQYAADCRAADLHERAELARRRT